MLTKLNLIPVYNLSESSKNRALNDETFERCREIFSQDGIVLIFAEGICVHERQIRKLKKFAARVAFNAWNVIGDEFSVLPVSINYNSFTHFGKEVNVHFGEAISKGNIAAKNSEAEGIKQFNQILPCRLSEGMMEEENDPSLASLMIIVLAPFAFLGWLLHALLYYPLRYFINRKTTGTVFYDSVLFGALMITYPFYWLLINFTGLFFIQNICIRLILIAMPFFSWLLLLWKRRTL